MPRERCAPTSVLILLWILAFCLAPAHALAPPLPLVAEKSRLLYPSDAEVWADAVGTVPTSVSGVTPGPTVEVRALVFRPRGADLTWANHTALYVHRGALPPGPKPMLSVVKLATGEEKTADPDANTEETNVYSLRPGGRFLVLGFFRNQRTQHQLAYAVLLEGKVDAAQALAQGKTLATTLARQVKLARLGPPHPPGATAARPSTAVVGANLQLLLRSIEQSPTVSQSVKAMARVVVPQATRIELWTFRTQAPVTDAAFFEFYLRECKQLGWGEPVSRDETQRGRPALLFQRPDGGVAMIRAEPTPTVSGTPPLPPATFLFVLMMEGKINVGELRK